MTGLKGRKKRSQRRKPWEHNKNGIEPGRGGIYCYFPYRDLSISAAGFLLCWWIPDSIAWPMPPFQGSCHAFITAQGLRRWSALLSALWASCSPLAEF